MASMAVTPEARDLAARIVDATIVGTPAEQSQTIAEWIDELIVQKLEAKAQPFKESDLSTSESRDFETAAVKIRASVRAATTVVIPRETLEDAGDAVAAAALVGRVARAARSRLLANPAFFVVREGEFVTNLSVSDFTRKELA